MQGDIWVINQLISRYDKHAMLVCKTVKFFIVMQCTGKVCVVYWYAKFLSLSSKDWDRSQLYHMISLSLTLVLGFASDLCNNNDIILVLWYNYNLYKYTIKSKQTRIIKKFKFKKPSRDWSLLQKVRKQGITFWYETICKSSIPTFSSFK